MKKLFSIMRMDFTLITREKIALYMVIAPALLSFIMLGILGGAGKGTVTFTVSSNVPSTVAASLSKLVRVELALDEEDVVQRVSRSDAVAGVYMKDGKPVLLVEGNEPTGFAEKSKLLLQRGINGDIPAFQNREIRSNSSLATEIAVGALILLGIFVAGAASGFNIVQDRESKAIRAIAISPLHLGGYVAARTLTALILCVVNVMICAAIMGRLQDIGLFAVIAAAALPLCGMVALALGTLSNNQISAIAALKLIMPISITLPIASVFVPEGARFLFWPFPMYWAFESILSAWAGKLDLLPLAMSFATGCIGLLLLSKFAARKLGLR